MKFSVNDRVIWRDPFKKEEVRATILKVNKQNCRILTADLSKTTVPFEEIKLAFLNGYKIGDNICDQGHYYGQILRFEEEKQQKLVLPIVKFDKTERFCHWDNIRLIEENEQTVLFAPQTEGDADEPPDPDDLPRDSLGNPINIGDTVVVSLEYGGLKNSSEGKVVSYNETRLAVVVAWPEDKKSLHLSRHLLTILPPDPGESSTDKEGSSTDKLSIINSFCEKAVEAVEIDLEEIRIDGGTQQRVKLDLNHVKQLEEQLEEGHRLEPIVVFYDGENYWLADGFHRLAAHKNHSEPTIAAHIKEGTRREAVLFSVGVNSDHKPCLPRSNADKRRAVETLLNDPEWSQWSDREIGRQCRVSDRLVNTIRKSICEYSQIDQPDTKKVTRNGKEYEMRTGNIGESSLRHEGESSQPQDERKPIMDSENLTSYGDCKKLEQEQPKPILVDTQEILIGFISNIELMSREQLKAAQQAIIARFTALNKAKEAAECQSDISQKAS